MSKTRRDKGRWFAKSGTKRVALDKRVQRIAADIARHRSMTIEEAATAIANTRPTSGDSDHTEYGKAT